jgi:hypothetical protein
METCPAVANMMREAAHGHGKDEDNDDDFDVDDGGKKNEDEKTSEADKGVAGGASVGAAGRNATATATATATSTMSDKGRLIKAEALARGRLKTEVLSGYVTAMGGTCNLLIIVGLFASTELGRLLSSYWLSWWSAGSLPGPPRSVGFYIAIYATISMTQTLINLSKQFALAKFGLVASSYTYTTLCGGR